MTAQGGFERDTTTKGVVGGGHLVFSLRTICEFDRFLSRSRSKVSNGTTEIKMLQGRRALSTFEPVNRMKTR